MLFKNYIILAAIILLIIVQDIFAHPELAPDEATKLTQQEIERQRLALKCQIKRERKDNQNPDQVVTQIGNKACVAHPDVSQGPFYIANELIRKDITDNIPGIPFELTIQVIDVNTCEPLVGAGFEIWSVDSRGFYAGFTGYNPETLELTGKCLDTKDINHVVHGPDGICMTDLHTFMRGVQFTDENGYVTFTANIPGYYKSRATHHHIIVWTDGQVKDVEGKLSAPEGSAAKDGGSVYYNGVSRHIGQLFFEDDVIADLYKRAKDIYPTEAAGQRPAKYTPLKDDFVWKRGGGFGLLDIAEVGEKDELLTKGVTGVVTVYVDAQKNVPVSKDYHLFTDQEVVGTK